MSKKIFGLLTALIVTVMLLSALTACQPDFHLHTFADELSSDGEHHWYAATCDHIDATLEKSAHTFGAAVVTKAATDYVEGEKTYTCTVCGAKKTERIPPKLGEHTHSYTEKVTDATCTENGRVDFFCACGDTYNQTILAKGHTPVTKEGKAPTCTEAGYTDEVVCGDCGTILTPSVAIDPIPHTEATRPATAPTCTVDGWTEETYCSVCTTVLVPRQTIPATGHNELVIPETPATCTTDGHTAETYCGTCTAVLVPRQTIPATGHTEVITPAKLPTCTVDGYTRKVHCKVCGDTLVASEAVPAGGHSFVGPYTPVAGGHNMPCEFCPERSEVESHTPDYTEATEEHGITCTTCHFVIAPALD